MKFYHATTKEAAASIQKDGVLKAGPFGEVFLCRSPLDACKFLIIRGVLQVSVFEVNLKRSEVTESHDHSEGFFQCKAYTHDGDIAVSDRVPVRTYDFQNHENGKRKGRGCVFQPGMEAREGDVGGSGHRRNACDRA